MKICLVKNLDEYIAHLQEHPEEIEALFQEMLINVTHFFRDPEAFQALVEKVIRPLIPIKHASTSPSPRVGRRLFQRRGGLFHRHRHPGTDRSPESRL